MEMHDRQDKNFVIADLMNDSVGEALYQGSMNPRSNLRCQSGMLANPLQRGIDRLLKSTPQTFLFSIIPIDGLYQFHPRRCEDDHLQTHRGFPKTSSTECPRTVPFR